MEIEERKPRDNVTRAPWTVSIAPFPGDPFSPELDRLDRSLKKTRDDVPDPELEEWKRKIIWPPDKGYGPPLFMTVLPPQMSKDMKKWLELLEIQRDPVARLCWNVFKYADD